MVRIATHTEYRRHDLAADFHIVNIVESALQTTSISGYPSRLCGMTDLFKVSFHVVDSFLEFRIAQRDEIWAKTGFIFSIHIHGHPSLRLTAQQSHTADVRLFA